MTVRLPPPVLCRVAGVLAVMCPLTAGGGVLAATTPQVTDILPSGVPLPPPTLMEVQPPEDTGSELLGEAAGARPWLARHGIRINMQDVEELWGLAAGGLSNEAPTQRDPSGTAFSTSGGTLFIGEAQFSADVALWIAGMDAPSLPGTWKLGGLYDTGRFPDQRYDSHGGLLASPDSTGQPLYHHDNWMMYVVADQMIWRAVPGSSKTISLFMRATANDGSRNRYSTEIQGGLTLDGLVPGRTNDTIGLAWGTGFYGSRAIGNAHDAVRLGTSLAGALKPEQHIEATYQAAATPYLIVQPDFQYFWHVGGTAFDPETGRSIGNGVVLGVNMTTTF